MPNPNGGYLQANSGYVWADGDVYRIDSLDQLEGYATGASFNNLGVINQPTQILLNKIQYTHSRQIVDETAITALQAFEALFTGQLAASNSFLQIPYIDGVRGVQVALLQWGLG